MSKSNSFSFPENVSFNAEAWDDFQALNHSLQIPVVKAICKVAENPRPRPDGYGKPLAGKLSSYCIIKLRDFGIRIIYRLDPPDSDNMNIIIIGMRKDDDVYDEAMKRI